MKRLSVLVVLALLASMNLAYGGDSSTLAVSCTIPVIPGVNTPLLESEIIKPQPAQQAQEEPVEGVQEIIQQQEQNVGPNTPAQIVVKTVYAR